MKQLICALLSAVMLTACGADGLPTKPEPKVDEAQSAEDIEATDVVVS